MKYDNINYEVCYRNIKYPRIELTTGVPLLILPHRYDPKELIERHQRWISKKLAFIEKCKLEAEEVELSSRSEGEFKKLVLRFVEIRSKELGVIIKKVAFRKMKTKWASYSSAGNITINKLMRFLPDYLVDYIVFHEVLHARERKHGENFKRMIAQEFPEFQNYEQELFVYWFKCQNNSGLENK